MFKRKVSLILAVAMLLSVLPVRILAQESAGSRQTPQAIGEEQEDPALTAVTYTAEPDCDLPEGETLFASYTKCLFYGSGPSTFGISGGQRLSGDEKILYDAMVPILRQIAAGQRTSTVITVGQTVTPEDGIPVVADAPATFTGETFGQESLDRLVTALLTDLPYEMYWYDKITGCGVDIFCSDKLLTVRFRFAVAGNYRGGSDYTVDASRAQAAVEAAANAREIVDRYASLSDYEKLQGYKNEICGLVAYDYAALEGDYFSTDNDPWQLISVFDGDYATNVVCEGYSKAFLYLCELTEFSDDTACYTVSGNMNGEAHMWNIVTLEGANYLADITNSDRKTAGENGELFLVGADGSVTEGYRAAEQYYTYDSDTLLLWGSDGILNLSASGYEIPAEIYIENDFQFEIVPGKSAKLTKYLGNDAEVTIPATVKGVPVTAIGYLAFYNNENLERVVIPASVTKIEDGYYSDGWTEENPFIHESFYGAFSCCEKLSDVVFAENSQMFYIGEWSFAYCPKIESIILPKSARILALSSFDNCTALTYIELPEGLESIAQNALSNTNLKEIHLPASCTCFDSFMILDNLEAFTVAQGNPHFRAHDGVLYDNLCVEEGAWTLSIYPAKKPDKTYRVAPFCTYINGNTFKLHLEFLETLYIGDKMSSRLMYPSPYQDNFAGAKCNIVPDETNPHYTHVDGALLSKDGKVLLQAAPVKDGIFTVPYGVEVIGGWSFAWREDLCSVQFPESIAVIAIGAFNECCNLESLVLPQSLREMEPTVFTACYNLKGLTFAGDAPMIGPDVFFGLELTVWYPADNPTWTSEVMQDYSGTVTWIPTGCLEGHKEVVTPAVLPTCTETGLTEGTHCAVCKEPLTAQSVIPATGHSWGKGVVTKAATEEKEGEKAFTCTVCGDVKHEIYYLTYLEGTTMTLGDSLAVGFVVDADLLEAENLYAVVTKHYADGREPVTVKIPQKDWNVFSGSLYYFNFEDVSAKEMCDAIFAVIYDADGNQVSYSTADSIWAYAMRMLGKEEVIADEALRTLYVDMLNYGAAAQLQFGYDPKNLANCYLTQEQKTWASDTVQTKSELVAGPGRAGTTLTLRNRITLDFIFNNEKITEEVAECVYRYYAVATYTNHYGEQITIACGDLQLYDGGGVYASVPGLTAADYGQPVTCTVYDYEGNAVAWATDSIEGYAHRMADTLPDMVQAIVKFCASAYRHFHR